MGFNLVEKGEKFIKEFLLFLKRQFQYFAVVLEKELVALIFIIKK